MTSGNAVTVVWSGETSHTADGLLVQPLRTDERAAHGEAVEFLRVALAGGERPASDVLREAAALGIAEITLRRAPKAVGVQVRREGFGKDGRFFLALLSSAVQMPDEGRTPKPAANGSGNLAHSSDHAQTASERLPAS